jgi:hypothetical protein
VLEKRWLTKDPWFQLICTIGGQAVIDLHRYWRFYEMIKKDKPDDDLDALRIPKMTDLICKGLPKWQYKQPGRKLKEGENPLAHIEGPKGRLNKPPSASQLRDNRKVGRPYMLNCFICHRYLDKDGEPIYQHTSFWCKACKMPLCKQDRKGMVGGWPMSCINEHMSTDDRCFTCTELHPAGKAVTKDQQVNLHPRRSIRGCS